LYWGKEKEKKRDSSTEETGKIAPSLGEGNGGQNSHAHHATGSTGSRCELSNPSSPDSSSSLAFYFRARVPAPRATSPSPGTPEHF